MVVFCYLLVDEDTGEAVIIDPGGQHKKILEKVKARNARVKWVVNTHAHVDHTAGNRRVMSRTGAGLLIHELEAPRLRSLSHLVFSLFLGGMLSPRPAGLLKHGDIITFGKSRLSVIHTPGHAAGGICLYSEGDLFTGDTLFTEGTGRTDLAGGSERELIQSLKEKIFTLPDETLIWPGHNYGRSPVSTVKKQKDLYRALL